MPELPEVETVKRGLEALVVGKKSKRLMYIILRWFCQTKVSLSKH